jgi:hypothetical protein
VQSHVIIAEVLDPTHPAVLNNLRDEFVDRFGHYWRRAQNWKQARHWQVWGGRGAWVDSDNGPRTPVALATRSEAS